MTTGGSSRATGRKTRPKGNQASVNQVSVTSETIEVTVTPVEGGASNGVEPLQEGKATAQPPAPAAPEEPIPASYEPVPLPELQLKEDTQADKAAPEAAPAPSALATAKPHHITVSAKPLPGNRPITPSKQQFRYMDGTHRPIAINPVPIRRSDVLPGHRPIAPGPLKEFHTGLLPGNRPIVPTNKSDETEEMIGYLD